MANFKEATSRTNTIKCGKTLFLMSGGTSVMPCDLDTSTSFPLYWFLVSACCIFSLHANWIGIENWVEGPLLLELFLCKDRWPAVLELYTEGGWKITKVCFTKPKLHVPYLAQLPQNAHGHCSTIWFWKNHEATWKLTNFREILWDFYACLLILLLLSLFCLINFWE